MDDTSKSILNIARGIVYLSIFLEIFAYAFNPEWFSTWSGPLYEIQRIIRRWYIYSSDHMGWSKLFTLLLVCIASIGAMPKKKVDFNAHTMVMLPLFIGGIMVVASVWCYNHPFGEKHFYFRWSEWIYIFCSFNGMALILTALDAISKHIKEGFMKDPHNWENESFKQCEKLETNECSVNIPMKYYYKGRMRDGWINILNPYRGTLVLGTPGSGKTYSAIEPFIRQLSAKKFALMVYDYKFPSLAKMTYYQYKKAEREGNLPPNCTFNMINFVDVKYSCRVNPIQLKYIPNTAAAVETAETLLTSLKKGAEKGSGNDAFFETAGQNIVGAVFTFIVNYNKKPYDAQKRELFPELETILHHYVPLSKRKPGINKDAPQPRDIKITRPTGRVFANKAIRDKAHQLSDAINEALKKKNEALADTLKEELNRLRAKHQVEPAYWLGQYSDLPHALSLLMESYETIFEVLQTDPEVAPLIAPFQSALTGGAKEQLEGMMGTARVFLSNLCTKEAYWIFAKEGNDFDLKISDPKKPCYLIIANDPRMESVNSALNALILNRLVTEVNSGGGNNNPVAIVVDELPTLFFNKLDRLIGTARSNKVAVVGGIQSTPQLKADYGETGMEKITTTITNVIAGSCRDKATLDWLSEMFGKNKQKKKGVTIDREKTSVNINEEMADVIPPSKIASLPTGWVVAQIAQDYTETKTGLRGSINVQKADEFNPRKYYCKTANDNVAIEAEKKDYVNYPLPVYYEFPSEDAKERILKENMARVNQDIKNMVRAIFNEENAR